MSWRAIYVLLWLVSLLVYSAPWVCAGSKCWIGWNFTFPFSFTYLLGLLLQLVVALTYYSPVTLSLLSGILMLLGVMGALSGITIAEAFLGNKIDQAGLGIAFIWSMAYTVLGPYVAKKMLEERKENVEDQEAFTFTLSCSTISS